MKFVLLIFCCFTALSQQRFLVEGKVLDKKQSTAIPFANVFLEGTTIGVQSDENGNFELKNVPVGNFRLVASMIGFETFVQTISITEHNVELNINLQEDVKLLQEVKIVGNRDKTWEKQYKVFEAEFLGTDFNKNEVKILNKEVLEFDFNKENRILTAHAKQPLLIENLELGYKYSYILENFEKNLNKVSYKGLGRFEMISSQNDKEIAKWNKKRIDAYEGSLKHFFKSLLSNHLRKAGFDAFYLIENPMGQAFNDELKTQEIIADLGNGFFRLNFKHKIKAEYKDLESSIIQQQSEIIINEAGDILDPYSVSVFGKMGNHRIAHTLPFDFDYQIEKKVKTVFQNHQEKVTITGFSSYYLAGEKLNLLALVQDVATQEATTLSVPLYVELIDLAQGKLIKRFILKLESGEATLNYTLPINLKTGNYQIRAYTNLMRNFSQSTFFKHNFTIFSQNYLQEIPSRLEQIADGTFVISENIEIEKGVFEIEKGLILKGTIQKITGKPNKKEVKLAVILQEIATEQKNTQHFVKNCTDKFIFENLEFYGKQNVTFITPSNQVSLDTSQSIPKIYAQNLSINWYLITKPEIKIEIQKRKEEAMQNHSIEENKNIILKEVIIKEKKKDNIPKQIIPPYYTMKEREVMTWGSTAELLTHISRFRCPFNGIIKIFMNGRELSKMELEYISFDINTATIENVMVFRDAAAGAYGACDCAIVLKQRYGNTFSMKKMNDSFVVEGYYR